MASVCDIQGRWRETVTQKIWIVDGICAQDATHQQDKNQIVLSDKPTGGIVWGKGNLIGRIEDGVLVWRSRQGESRFCWERLKDQNGATETTAERKAKVVLPIAQPTPLQVGPIGLPLQEPHWTMCENQSPRSTNSATSNETAAITAGMGTYAVNANSGNTHGTKAEDAVIEEIKMLLEMAGHCLMAGDVCMSMRYTNLAQQVQKSISYPINIS
jgi:hypothetical protein